MPKKSKREKILAESRRNTVKAETVAAPSFQYVASQVPKAALIPVSYDSSELTAIKKDLTKTVLLASIAIAAEIILFWFERR